MSASSALDTRVEVETPEGIHLHLLPAGVVPRALAWAIDAGIRLMLVWLCVIPLAFMGDSGHGIYLIVVFSLMWLYPVLFEVMWQGQTPGKKALSLRVVHADGTAVGWVASATRNLLRTVDMLPLGYALGIVTGLFDGRGRRLGDMAAGTLVVHSRGLEPPPLPSGAAAVNPPPGLLRPDREALLAFAERHRQLSEERQIELAQLLQPLTQAQGAAGVQQVLGMSTSLIGQRGERA
ncbi:RDD family protein [Aquimonas sp.]|jgi:uncharacterized RDD family membrane protein YckC|uniref:RDD family protein n=1 Tax=Aquimonas sp. TaxID=1872588 RepID=UPI0037BE2C06